MSRAVNPVNVVNTVNAVNGENVDLSLGPFL